MGKKSSKSSSKSTRVLRSAKAKTTAAKAKPIKPGSSNRYHAADKSKTKNEKLYPPGASSSRFVKDMSGSISASASTTAEAKVTKPSTPTASGTTVRDLAARMCTQLNLSPHTVEISQQLAEKASRIRDLATRSPLSIAAASVYLASSLLGQPQSAAAISRVAGVSAGSILLSYNCLFRERTRLIDPAWTPAGKTEAAIPDEYVPEPSISEYCVRFCYQLGLKKLRFFNVAAEISSAAVGLTWDFGSFTMSEPRAAAAAAVFMAAAVLGNSRTVEDVAAVSGVAEDVIRRGYGYLYEVRDVLIEKEWVAEGCGSLDNLPVEEDSSLPESESESPGS